MIAVIWCMHLADAFIQGNFQCIQDIHWLTSDDEIILHHISQLCMKPLSALTFWPRSEIALKKACFAVVENEKLGLCLIPGLQRRARIRFNIRFSRRSSAVHISVWDATAIYQQTFIFSGAGLREHWVFKVKSRAESILTAGAEAPNASN